MKSEWRVACNYIGEEARYIPYRLLDKDAVDHSGNRETYGTYVRKRETAQVIVNLLNSGKIGS